MHKNTLNVETSPLPISTTDIKSHSQQLKIHYIDNAEEPLSNIFYYIKDEKGNESWGKTDDNGLTKRVSTENAENLTILLGKNAYYYLKTNKKI